MNHFREGLRAARAYSRCSTMRDDPAGAMSRVVVECQSNEKLAAGVLAGERSASLPKAVVVHTVSSVAYLRAPYVAYRFTR
eukprot:1704839-Prymnesium_polylepis.1